MLSCRKFEKQEVRGRLHSNAMSYPTSAGQEEHLALAARVAGQPGLEGLQALAAKLQGKKDMHTIDVGALLRVPMALMCRAIVPAPC